MTPDTAPPPSRIWRPWLIALALWLLLAASASVALWHLRRDALDSQARELNLLSLALTDELDRGLRGAEEGLRALRTELQQGRLPLTGSDSTLSLHTRAELMPLVRTLWLVDRSGKVLAASDDTPPPPLAAFSPALDMLAADATSLSRPFAVADHPDTQVALALPMARAPGTGDGWILAAIPASALLGAFSAARPAADARMAVLRADGVRLAGANLGPPARDEASVAQHLASRPSLALRSFRDGSEHLVGLHSMPRYGLRVLVSRDLAAMLAAWRGAAEGAGIALALLLAIGAAAVHFVQRAERRRSEAQRALQAQLTRASKLESLGTLAGGVAHDFNNVLAGIVGFGEMAQDAAPAGSAQARHLDKVLQAALRGKALVERILAFSRGGARSSTVFELEPVVEEVLTLLAASLRPGVVLERALEAPAARLRGDPTQAFEAVMNLCTNAMQAMPGGGMLSVQLQRDAVTAPRVLSHSALAAGDYLALSVTDQGEGIRAEVMEHLFEPFFTTRGAQSGTGLGLAVVHGVVAEFGGAIDVQSQPGQGARFTLYLPECTETLGAVEPVPKATAPGAGQRLLVVDDEPELVGLVLEMLRGLGYAPEGCIDPAAALQALREHPHHFAAVITDEVMPELSGTRLTQALRAFAPDLPVLLVSGYGGASLAQRAAAAGVSRVLAKPLQRADLARALADLLR
ncbi:ATP-binding protein [Aquabacterium sp.]|uniref:ATP-binding protein n=1 Tax=Aquabacterium sp. TaxID=1872578 RepID=UPI002CDBEB79|nr:ATP-binding protein [Aquabacterium sp.]HSW07337.1 ATP-binding protein [Aquabacterium sp.]